MLRLFDPALDLMLVCVLSLLLCGYAACAETLHVSHDGAAGNPGTEDEPLPTIAAALQLVGPGDTIRVHAGTWAETIT
ncbi:MAG: hypothetical protein ACP5KN_13050, partial [Armatimonadota bacterium]